MMVTPSPASPGADSAVPYRDTRSGATSGPGKRRAALAASAALAAATLAACSQQTGAVRHHLSSHTTTTTRRAAPRTFLGPDGVESSAVIAENRLPGTTAWRITGPNPPLIQGFANTAGAEPGQDVTLYVSTSASTFHVDAYRMGWYGGDGAHLVWQSGTVKGHRQPHCPVLASTRTVVCDTWSPSLTMRVGSDWMSGDYLLKLVGSGGQQAYILLTVWDPTSHATYLFVARTLTEQGWNPWGGYDFYQGTGACAPGAPTYPPCNRAYAVSIDRPQAVGNGAADFLSNEFPLVEYAERHGLDATYVTDITLDEHPELALHHRVILSLGHDETWTAPELFAVRKAIAHGVNVVFFGAAALVRHARLASGPMGPDTVIVDYRNSALDPLDGHASPWDVTGNTWASPPTDYSETSLVGELYSGYLDPGTGTVPFVVWDPVSWLFRGTGLEKGSTVPGVVDADIDHVATAYPTPPDLEVLGHSPVPLSIAYTNQGTWGNDTYSDFTYYTQPTSKAGVVDTGTTNWICAMTSCAANPTAAAVVQRITGNLLRLFGEGPAGKFDPSVSNTASVLPPGS